MSLHSHRFKLEVANLKGTYLLLDETPAVFA